MHEELSARLQRPYTLSPTPYTFSRSALFSAYAFAACLTHSLSSWAFILAARRCLLQGPLPFTTFQNSFQLISPKSYRPVDSFHLSSASGKVIPKILTCSAAMSTKFCL